MSDTGSQLVLDATVLSNFARTESIDWLTATFGTLRTVPAVRAELDQGVEAGYEYLARAVSAIDEGSIPLLDIDDATVAERYPTVRDRLDRGEAAALVAVLTDGGTLVTDDGTARTVGQDRGVPVTGSIGLLVRGIREDAVSIETADTWLQTWIQQEDYYAPVGSVTDALPDEE